MKHFSLIIGVIICATGYMNGVTGGNIKKSSNIMNQEMLDTLNADDYNLIFFRPNENEFNELLNEYKNESNGLYEVDSDFGFYTNKVYDSLSKTDFKIKIVEERIIKYSTKSGTKYLDRLNNSEHPYGTIFNNVDCDPRIEFGVMTDIGIFQVLSEFNKNCM